MTNIPIVEIGQSRNYLFDNDSYFFLILDLNVSQTWKGEMFHHQVCYSFFVVKIEGFVVADRLMFQLFHYEERAL